MESSAHGVDLDITDPDGNVLLRMKNGGAYTKNFASNPTIITMKADGTGDFATLRDALASITDADSVNNPYEIHLLPGVYDTLAGYTEAEIQAADIGGGYTDSSMVGLKLTDGISIIGIGDRDSVVLTAELSTANYSADVRGNISTINMKESCRIENLTIKARCLRYCVHDDFPASKRYIRIVKNCKFIAYGTSMSSNPATTYGVGLREHGCDALFEDCDFGYNVGFHSKTSMQENCNIVFKNCTGLRMYVGDWANEADTAHHTFALYGCDFEAVSMARPTATTPHISIIGSNNPNTMDLCLSADKPLFMNIIKTKLSALPVGTLVNVGAGEITASSGGITAVKATNKDCAVGIIIMKDTDFDYIQKGGFIRGDRMGIASLAIGDYVTVDSDMELTTTGATASNAVGVVKYTDSDDRSQIWLM